MGELVEEMMAAEYTAAHARVRANPDHAELVAAADAETGNVYFDRNRLALQVELEMPSIVALGERIRHVRESRRKTWLQRLTQALR